MKFNPRRDIALLMVGLLIICMTAVALETRLKVIQRAYDNFVLDNRNHYLSCQELPTKLEVEKALEQHKDVVRNIEQIAPGFVGVEIGSLSCEGKADLLIWYGTHQQRIAIEKIVDGDTFFGIPYRLQNR